MSIHRVILTWVVLSTGSGCATLPSYRDDAVTAAEIIRHIKCELRAAVWAHPENRWVRGWKAGLDFTFEVYHKGGLESDNSWVFPLNHGATFVVALTGGFSGEATRTERIRFDESLDELHKDPKLWCDDKEAPDRHARRLGGKLGLADLLERVGRSIAYANLRNLSALDYNLDYVIKKNAGVTPKFNLVPIGKEKLFTGSLAWTGSERDTQTLKLVLTPPAVAATCPVARVGKACPTLVYIVNTKDGGGAAWAPESAPPRRVQRSFATDSGLSQADKQNLNNARAQNVLQTIESEVRRLDVNN